MSKVSGKTIGLWAGVVVFIIVGLTIVNWFVYPFTSANPNYADVEAVFNTITIPSDWTLVEKSENKGIAGRQCPVEPETTCFSKSATYALPSSTDINQIKGVIKNNACMNVFFKERREYEPGRFSTDYICTSGLIYISGTYREVGGELSVSIRARSI